MYVCDREKKKFHPDRYTIIPGYRESEEMGNFKVSKSKYLGKTARMFSLACSNRQNTSYNAPVVQHLRMCLLDRTCVCECDTDNITHSGRLISQKGVPGNFNRV